MLALVRIAAAFALLLAAHAAPADVVVVEYRHAGFDHYFVTPVADEIAKLDARQPPFEQWSRTGRTFRAYEGLASKPGSVAVCRFFNATFAPKSSHFYTPRGLGCEDVIARFPDWQLETDALFAVLLPDAAGACPAGTVPVYRLYNNGKGGAPNHRLVTSLDDRNAMLAQGYVAEGAGIGVGMCAPVEAAPRPTAEGLWKGSMADGRAAWILVLDTGRYYLVHGDPAPTIGAGIVTGVLDYDGSGNASGDLRQVPLSAALPGTGTSVRGTLSADSITLDLGGPAAIATYDATYDRAPSLGAIAGAYRGASGHFEELGQPGSARATIDAAGKLVIAGAQCDLSGTIAPRPRGNVYEGVLTGGFACRNLTALKVYVTVDAASGKLRVLSEPFRTPSSGATDVYAMFGTRE